MSEAMMLLTRAAGAYGQQVTMFARKLEKATPGTDEARAAQHNIDQCKARVADIGAALKALQQRGFVMSEQPDPVPVTEPTPDQSPPDEEPAPQEI